MNTVTQYDRCKDYMNNSIMRKGVAVEPSLIL